MKRGVRPRAGEHVSASGERTPIRFVETGDRDVFLAVTLDGAPVVVFSGESIVVDMIGPGQEVITHGSWE